MYNLMMLLLSYCISSLIYVASRVVVLMLCTIHQTLPRYHSLLIFIDEKFKILDDDENEDSVLTMPAVWYKRLHWIIGLPLTLAMYATIPDCRRTRWKKWFFVTFIMSIMWISVFSYLMVWMITIVGRLLTLTLSQFSYFRIVPFLLFPKMHLSGMKYHLTGNIFKCVWF